MNIFLGEHLRHGEDPKELSVKNLYIWGILHCKTNKGLKGEKEVECNEKGIALFNCLQEGGAQAHERISANDKDWGPVTDKLFSLALLDFDTGEKIPYFNKEVMHEIFEQVREDDLIDKIFGL